MHQCNPNQLWTRLDAGEQPPLLLDVREPWEFELCRIEGSVNLPMNRIPAAIDQLDPARETVVICHHGMRSLQVARFLEQQGFEKTINLTGGIDAWSREVDPSVPTY